MRSFRKVGLLVAAFVAVMAISLPAVASAASLTSAGKAVPMGSNFSATSTNFSFKTTAGTGICEKMTIPAVVLKNTGGIVEAKSDGFGTAQNCYVGLNKFTFKNLEMQNLRLEAPNAGKMSLKFVAGWGETDCQVEAANAWAGYTAGNDTFTLGNTVPKVAPASCGPFTLNANFSLKDSAGNPLILK